MLPRQDSFRASLQSCMLFIFYKSEVWEKKEFFYFPIQFCRYEGIVLYEQNYLEEKNERRSLWKRDRDEPLGDASNNHIVRPRSKKCQSKNEIPSVFSSSLVSSFSLEFGASDGVTSGCVTVP